MIKSLALIVGLALPILIYGQSVSFEAYCSAKQVTLNGYFEVSFTLKNANGTNFNPPDFKGFSILAGPSTSTSMQIINGEVTREMGFTFTLQPTRIGQFTISPATIMVNGKTLKTEALNIEVVKSTANNSHPDAQQGEVFIRLIPSKNKAFPGEQILLDYKLYTTVSIDGYDIPQEPDYRGFYAQELRRFESRAQGEVIGGKQYTTKVLRRIALFPQQTGTLTITPATLQLTVVENDDGSGFFFSRKVRPVIISTDPVDIVVSPFPEPAPSDFSGAVGSYEFQASVNNLHVTTDDAISMLVSIGGNGDIKRVQPLDLMLSDSFEVYPPKILQEQLVENQGEITGKKMLEYLILPKYPGNYTLQPSFSYFDPAEDRFVTLIEKPVVLSVKQGNERNNVQLENKEFQKKEGDIRFIKFHARMEKNNTPFIESARFWGLTALPLLAFIGVFFYRRKLERDERIGPLFLKTKLANKEAQKRLAMAHQHMQADDSRAFYDGISKASLGYVCDKLNIPLSQLTKDNVKEKLQSMSISPNHVDDFMTVIQRCEMALFAGMDNAASMKETYEKAMAVIVGIEGEAGKGLNV